MSLTCIDFKGVNYVHEGLLISTFHLNFVSHSHLAELMQLIFSDENLHACEVGNVVL